MKRQFVINYMHVGLEW